MMIERKARGKGRKEEENQFSALCLGPRHVISSVSNLSAALGLPVG